MYNLCTPAFIYLIFSILQVVFDMFNGLFNQALLKFMVSILFTVLLNSLCIRGLSVISWILVFLPFILLSIVTALILFTFGISPSTGYISDKNNVIIT